MKLKQIIIKKVYILLIFTDTKLVIFLYSLIEFFFLIIYFMVTCLPHVLIKFIKIDEIK